MSTIDVTFTNQQLEILDRFLTAKDGGDYAPLVRRALDAAEPGEQGVPKDRPAPAAPPTRPVVAEHLIAPGTGKAIEVAKGQIIRIEQVEGGQCGDLNIFARRNRHERIHVGRTRAMEADNSPTTGDLIWSNAPWERPLATVLANTARTDTLFPYCSALLYSKYFDTHAHTNCQQIQTEAQREYGLAPYDVHESFNLFMYVSVDADGGRSIDRNESHPGDYIEFHALDDIVAVPNVCGDDLGKSSNYFLRHLKAVVLDALPQDQERTEQALAAGRADAVLQQPYDLPDAPLVHDDSYVPSFPYLPLTFTTDAVEVSNAQAEALDGVWNR
ncbi:DUF1989 domain-containing protein, partial [Streptomyces cinereoruber]|uniref:DUF1989 domain-containing protein n=1 Tax=Streptomyces cinereoruber TaxID=67260 RepID=UPI003633D57F